MCGCVCGVCGCVCECVCALFAPFTCSSVTSSPVDGKLLKKTTPSNLVIAKNIYFSLKLFFPDKQFFKIRYIPLKSLFFSVVKWSNMWNMKFPDFCLHEFTASSAVKKLLGISAVTSNGQFLSGSKHFYTKSYTFLFHYICFSFFSIIYVSLSFLLYMFLVLFYYICFSFFLLYMFLCVSLHIYPLMPT